MEQLGVRARQLAPPMLALAVTLLTMSSLWGVKEPLYIIRGPVEGRVYALRATLTYMGVEWVPGPLAVAIAIYATGLVVLLAGWVSTVAGLLFGDTRYSRLGGYLAVAGFSIILGAYTLIGYVLQHFQEHIVFETNFGIIDMGSSTVENGPPGHMLASLRGYWPAIALLTLILAELSVEEHGG